MKLGLLDMISILKRNKDLGKEAYTYDFDDIDDRIQKIYLKRLALDTCANFISRAVSQSEFKIENDIWYYKLNVRPCSDMSAAQFWQAFVYKLIVDNRVLVVVSDSDDLLIADSWSRREYAVYEDVFEDVTVKDYTFAKSFKMNEVLYLEYNNEKLSRVVDGLFDDYGELYSRLLEAAQRNNQIRASMSVDGASGAMDDKKTQQLQQYVDKLFRAFKSRSVAVIPLLKGFNYTEYTSSSKANNISQEQISKIISDLIDMVADALGIPAALVHGNRAELKDNMKAFYKFCLGPLLEKIADELNAKLYEPKDYSREKHIEVVGINKPDIFELADAIDKLISSSAFNPNEVRKALGYDPREGGDEYVITKNWETTQNAAVKGVMRSDNN